MGKLKRKITELDESPVQKRPKEQFISEELLEAEKNFVDNFIYDFTEDELVAKHTLETIFKKCNSFGYAYKCIQEALDLDPKQIGSFVKAIAVVADLQLIELSKKTNIFDKNYQVSTGSKAKNILFDSPTEYETDGQSNAELFYQQDPNFYQLFDALLYNLLQNTDIQLDMNGEYGMNEVDWYVRQLEEGFLSKLLPFGPEIFNILIRISNLNNLNYFPKFSQISTSITHLLHNGHFLIVHWINKILNKSETSGTSLFDTGELEWQQSNNRNCIDVVIKLFDLSVNIHGKIQSYDLAREKLKRLEKIENEGIEYKRKLEGEKAKKLAAKRNAVSFILDRKIEYDKLSNNSKMKHPFYILGQNVRMCNISSLKKFSKKLKSLLHPDTETDSEWKVKCERAFKEASAALDQSLILLENPARLSHYANGPIIDFFDQRLEPHNNFTNTNGVSTNDIDTKSYPFNVTYMILPEFTVECIDRKIGTLQITIDLTLISQKLFTGNTYFNVLIHRPVYSDEPITIHPKIEQLSSWKKVDILFTNSNFHTTTVEAIQPISLGNMKKYYVGVQIGCKTGASLIKWKSIYVELDKRGRNDKQVEMLLNTFSGAPFISKSHVEMVNSIRDNKGKMERYLNECIEMAQRWADKC